MSGVIFIRTQMLDELVKFYTEKIGCHIWIDQKDVIILKHGNFIFGLHSSSVSDLDTLLTFFYDTKDDVDKMAEIMTDNKLTDPNENKRYSIYNFFAKDPEGRKLEFQHFNHRIEHHLTADELLLKRRSIRKYTDTPVSDELLYKVIDLSRYAPTARNSQPYYFKIIKDRDTIDKLGAVRERATTPISNAPLAVAVVSDPEISKRHIQDGCIGAYHFLLAAFSFGLGTCWIADMDRDEVKKLIGVPKNHYVVTVTPLGFPAEYKENAPEKKDMDFYLR